MTVGSASSAASGISSNVLIAAIAGSGIILLIITLIAALVVQRPRSSEEKRANYVNDVKVPEEELNSEESNSNLSYLERSAVNFSASSSVSEASWSQDEPKSGLGMDKDVWGRSESQSTSEPRSKTKVYLQGH